VVLGGESFAVLAENLQQAQWSLGGVAKNHRTDSPFPRTEYVEAWKVLQRNLLRRDACRRMLDLLFIAHEQACEVELAHLLLADLNAGCVPDPHPLRHPLPGS